MMSDRKLDGDVTTCKMEKHAHARNIRLCGIQGYSGRFNDLLYFPPKIAQDGAEMGKMAGNLAVFFGGDMQDFIENMKRNQDNQNYIKWNLEDTGVVIGQQFPDSHVIVIRPSRMELKTFSCFDNFVPSNNYGAPRHVPMHFALEHLNQLLENTTKHLQNTDFYTSNLNLTQSRLSLIGFSKGCVVLNQFLYEFHHLQSETPENGWSKDLIGRIWEMYWLDGGHSGGKETWITDGGLLQSLAKMGINVNIHVTPYQIKDSRRPWIRKEEKMFGEQLRKFGASVQRTVHFKHRSASLDLHFEVINVFKNS